MSGASHRDRHRARRAPRTDRTRAGRPRRRLLTVLVVVVALFAVLAGRLAQLQAVSADELSELSADQTVRTLTIAADRGSILDRNGHELAMSIPRPTVYTDPELVGDPRETAAALAPVLDVDATELEETLGADNRFGYLARQVSDEVASRVEELDLPGVHLVDEPHRFRTAGDLATSIIGPTDIDNAGIGGLELQHDDLLSGTPGHLTVERDPEGRTIPLGEHEYEAPERGDELVLTIDRALQYRTERTLVEHVEANAAEAAMAVMMQPDTGEILAMANVEADDSGTPRVSTNNLALTTVFEPGSVMKVVGMAGALEEGAVDASSWVNVPDQVTVGGATFTEYEPHGGGSWPLKDVLVNSSNTGSINLARMLGDERLHHYFRAFGLGEPTGLDFPNELSGSVRPVEEWWGSSIGSMPIGQGISATPLQMLLVYNALANDGVWVEPSLVRATVDADGVEHLEPTGDTRRVIGSETSAQVREMLVEVVSRGTAQAAQVDGYLPAGKTGTAQIPAPDGGYVFSDGTKHYMATFVGFLPAHDPQLSMIVVTRHPTAGAYTGGTVSGPVFAELAEFAVEHLQIPPAGVELAPGARGPTEPDAREAPAYTLGEPPEGRVRARPASAPAE